MPHLKVALPFQPASGAVAEGLRVLLEHLGTLPERVQQDPGGYLSDILERHGHPWQFKRSGTALQWHCAGNSGSARCSYNASNT